MCRNGLRAEKHQVLDQPVEVELGDVRGHGDPGRRLFATDRRFALLNQAAEVLLDSELPTIALMAPSMAMSKRFIWGGSPESGARVLETGAGAKGSVDCRTQANRRPAVSPADGAVHAGV